MQAMIDAITASAKNARSDYHLTLGKLIEFLETAPEGFNVVLDYDKTISVGEPHSYRGYYSDLALEPVDDEITKVKALLVDLKGTLNITLEGYKGGDFLMDAKVPVWISSYGSCSNRAVVGVHQESNLVVLDTKEIKD